MEAGSTCAVALELNGLTAGLGAASWATDVDALLVGNRDGLEKAAGAFPLGGPENTAAAESLDVLTAAVGDANMADAEEATAATGD